MITKLFLFFDLVENLKTNKKPKIFPLWIAQREPNAEITELLDPITLDPLPNT
jgi:hypothetical protein